MIMIMIIIFMIIIIVSLTIYHISDMKCLSFISLNGLFVLSSSLCFCFALCFRLRVTLRRAVTAEHVYQTTNITPLTAVVKTVTSETYAKYLVSFP